MVSEFRVSRDIRRLAVKYPDATFTGKDLLNILHGRTLGIYTRLGETVVEKSPQPASANINENKNKFVGKVVSKRSFNETPADGVEWAKRISTIRSELGLSHDVVNSNDLIDELKRLKNKSNSTLKAVKLSRSDITYLLKNLEEEK